MTLMSLLAPIAGLVKVRYRGTKADIDSPFSKLHYRTTTTILFICCLLVTANDLFGDTINCISKSIPGNVLNTYCWIMSTFSVPSTPGGEQGKHFAHQGVEPYIQGKSDRVLHAYYQWVPLVLFLQGLSFYLPHYIWKTLEDRKMDKITNNLRGRVLSLEDRQAQCKVLVNYINETFHMHNFYAFKYFMCDVLNLLNVVGQMFIINKFLGGVFMAYGIDVLYWTEDMMEQRNDPMKDVFPRITKCTFHKYGPSGTMEQHDAMCILALNIINEKIYIFVWFWFIVLALITCLHFIYVFGIINIPSMRKIMIERNTKADIKHNMDILMKKAELGDWFILFLLSKNMDSILYHEFILQLTKKLKVAT